MNTNINSHQCLTIGLFLFQLGFSACKNEGEKPCDMKKESRSSMLPIINDSIPYLKSLFTAAIIDAQNPEPNEVFRELTTIEGNSDLIDTLINNEKHVLMVSWKSNPEYFCDEGYYNTKKYDIWVTLAPSLRDSCIHFFKTQKDPNMRLRQLLGLQPFTIETFFLEIWVKPDDLFRPCPDNETNDSFCGLNLPENVTPEYRKWFNDTRAIQYTDCSDTIFNEFGYPWTQLGYTYDWSPENSSHIGLSEFIIRRNSAVYIRSKQLTLNYCK